MTLASHAEPATSRPPATFIDEISAMAAVETRLRHCIQCGTCGGSCPSAADMEHTPRELFAMIRAGMRDAVLSSNTPWMCVSCNLCVVRCPQDILITDVMFAVKSVAARDGRPPVSAAPGFSRAFVSNVRRFGRSYEVGLVVRHYLRHFPTRIPGMAPLGVGMLASGRMGLVPNRIRDVRGLRAILHRAAKLEGRS